MWSNKICPFLRATVQTPILNLLQWKTKKSNKFLNPEEPSVKTKSTQALSSAYPGPARSFGHCPKLMTRGQDWNVDGLVNRELCLLAQLLLHHDGPIQCDTIYRRSWMHFKKGLLCPQMAPHSFQKKFTHQTKRLPASRTKEHVHSHLWYNHECLLGPKGFSKVPMYHRL